MRAVPLTSLRLSTLVVVACVLSACMTTGEGGTQFSRRDPQRGKVIQSAETHGVLVSVASPVMLRIIKESSKLELWRQGASGWTQVRTYEICKFAGGLGPKQRSADFQAPEGFYEIRRHSLNPASKEYLSINTGYPNAYDRAHGRTGGDVMIHGGCKSAGCFAMTDGSIEEIYAAVRDALDGGQRSIQLQIYPFQMTDSRMAGLSKGSNAEFWKQLKAGWDWFERYQRPIPMGVSSGRYQLLDTR